MFKATNSFLLFALLSLAPESFGAPALVTFAPGQGGPAATRSENGLYSADISSDAPNEILLGVRRHEAGAKVLVWSTRVPWPGANAASPFLVNLNRFISNDGNTVILRNHQMASDMWMWISKEKEPRRYLGHDFERVLGRRLADFKFGTGGSERFGGTLEFLHEAKNVFAMWFPALDAWATIDLATGTLTGPKTDLSQFLSLMPNGEAAPQPPEQWLTPPSEELLKMLGTEATRRSLEAVRKHQPHFVQSMLRPVREKIARFVPSLKPPPQASITMLPDAVVGYFFLATRKEPAAEALIRKLLGAPFRANLSSTELMSPPGFTVRSDDRVIGDMAWRIWNDELMETADRSIGRAYWKTDFPGHYFGGVSGQVRLPIPSPEKDPGNVRVYLISSKVPMGKWAGSKDVIELYCDLNIGARFPAGGTFRWSMPPLFDTLNYSFLTVTPGEYRLKAVWDRRGPIADPTTRAIPEAGDYQSVESEPFTIKEGVMLTGPVLECTNRVGQADTYYLADEAWARIAPAETRTRQRLAFPQTILSFQPFPETKRPWIVQTNTAARLTSHLAAKNIHFVRAEVIQVLPKGDPLERDELFVTFEIIGEVEMKARVSPIIRDGHGCTFPATASLSPLKPGRSELTVRVPVFPRNEEFTFELRFVPENTVLCSYTMQNRGVTQKARWQARALPLTRAFGNRIARLTQLTRSTGARLELGSEEAATLWSPRSLVYEDSEGNRSLSADEFCRRESAMRVIVEDEEIVREFIAPISD